MNVDLLTFWWISCVVSLVERLNEQFLLSYANNYA